MSASLTAFGLGASLLVSATPATDDPPNPPDYRCGIINVEENPAHPLGSDFLESLLIENVGQRLRVATFDAGLSSREPGLLAADLAGGQNARAQQVAEVIKRADADVLLLTGFDADEQALATFNNEYLKNASSDGPAVDYRYRYVGPSNLGVASGADLDQDKIVGGPGDAWGYGEFPGQGSMVLLSRHPIDIGDIQVLTDQRWAEVPGNRLAEAGLTQTASAAIPVMESGLWDVPLTIAGQKLRVIAVQARPGSEQLGYAAARHHDELTVIGDWVDAADYLRDDQGAAPSNTAPYVVMGELGRDERHNAAVDSLLEKIGVAEQGIHDQLNYILPDGAFSIVNHGSIELQPVDGAPDQDAEAGEPSELLWSDLNF